MDIKDRYLCRQLKAMVHCNFQTHISFFDLVAKKALKNCNVSLSYNEISSIS